ncbi:NucA/NucB deoxyribonuclease domain-containing protein [Microbispora sp. H10836]|uniref:NucA/NucB deoxyribonuclease domain-containing protein n=1 Tax=Microbispora sp. H10836 TaxID=2729106 RepID=UPI001474FF4D|nr:NucA/NucB deoxyribonuclease domain-containing protein [Microbispora sp. H10836]
MYHADADWLYFSATFVIHTYAGDKSGNLVMGATAGSQTKPRDIAVWTHIDPVLIDDDYLLEANKFTLSVDAKPTKPGGSCASIDGYTTRTDSLGEFEDDGWDEFRFRSSGNWSDYCTIRPWFKFDGYHKGFGAKSIELWDIPRNRTATRDNAAKIRCDSSYRGNKVTGYRDCCTIIGANPVYTMVRSDPWKGEVAQHVHKALYLPNQTVPVFRDDSGNTLPKSIPGRYGTVPLTFVPRKAKAPDGRTIRGKNRYQVKLACRQWFPNADDDELPDDNDIPGELQCDEFPFASTHEGAWSAGRNFSVQALSATDNGRDGSDLGIFYARYRLTDNRPFWIAIK